MSCITSSPPSTTGPTITTGILSTTGSTQSSTTTTPFPTTKGGNGNGFSHRRNYDMKQFMINDSSELGEFDDFIEIPARNIMGNRPLWFLNRRAEVIRIHRTPIISFHQTGFPPAEYFRFIPSKYNESSFLAVFWASVSRSTRVTAKVIEPVLTNNNNTADQILAYGGEIIAAYLSLPEKFKPDAGLLVTWDNMAPEGRTNSSKTNFIQLLLIAKEDKLYSVSLYHNITWQVAPVDGYNETTKKCDPTAACLPALVGLQLGRHYSMLQVAARENERFSPLDKTILVTQIDALPYAEFSTNQKQCIIGSQKIFPISVFYPNPKNASSTPAISDCQVSAVNLRVSNGLLPAECPSSKQPMNVILTYSKKGGKLAGASLNILFGNSPMKLDISVNSALSSGAHFTVFEGTFEGTGKIMITVNYHPDGLNLKRTLLKVIFTLDESNPEMTIYVKQAFVKGLPHSDRFNATNYWEYTAQSVCFPYYSCTFCEKRTSSCCYLPYSEFGNCAQCKNGCRYSTEDTTDQNDSQLQIYPNTHCERLGKADPFSFCLPDPYVSYLINICSREAQNTSSQVDLACGYGAQIAEYCQKKLLPGTRLMWKAELGCIPNCTLRPNTIREECMSPCQKTCWNRNPSKYCELPCSEGCACKPGFVLDGNGVCVEEQDCGCLDENKEYFEPNQTWTRKRCSEVCHCHVGSGNITCRNQTGCVENADCGLSLDANSCSCDTGFRNHTFPNGTADCRPISYCNCSENADCIEGAGFAICQCKNASVTGEYCNTTIKYCNADSCHNGGTCTEVTGGFKCLCPKGTSGMNCEERNKCTIGLSPCQNNGTCIPIGNDDYQCLCPELHSGKNCDTVYTTTTQTSTTSTTTSSASTIMTCRNVCYPATSAASSATVPTGSAASSSLWSSSITTTTSDASTPTSTTSSSAPTTVTCRYVCASSTLKLIEFAVTETSSSTSTTSSTTSSSISTLTTASTSTSSSTSTASTTTTVSTASTSTSSSTSTASTTTTVSTASTSTSSSTSTASTTTTVSTASTSTSTSTLTASSTISTTTSTSTSTTSSTSSTTTSTSTTSVTSTSTTTSVTSTSATTAISTTSTVSTTSSTSSSSISSSSTSTTITSTTTSSASTRMSCRYICTSSTSTTTPVAASSSTTK